MTDAEMLKFAIENGIIDTALVREKIEMQKRQEILKAHPYDIWQGSGKRKLWYTYLPDPKKGRIQKTRSTREKLEDMIVEFYQENEKAEKEQIASKKITMEQLFPEWLRYKSQLNAAGSYIKKLYTTWNRFYKNEPIIHSDIRDLTETELEVWAYKMVSNYKFTKKQYYNVTVIIRQSLEYAKKVGYIQKVPFTVKMNPKNFKEEVKKQDETQVFMMDEQPIVEQACWKRWRENSKYTAPLAILFSFRTGLRVGELVALKWSDINDSYLTICREEVEDYVIDKDNRVVYNGVVVAEHTKGSYGTREVYLTEEAHNILGKIKESNEKYGNECENYVFCIGNERLKESTVIKRLYDMCDDAGIPRKSTHKIRKTVISTMIDGGVNINTIRKMVGHKKESTTYRSYCFDRRPKEEREELFENVLNSQSFKSINNIQVNQGQSENLPA